MTRDNRTGWSVLVGLALIGLGVWLLLGRLFYPFAVVLDLMARIGWPLVLVGLGVLLILRARGGGINMSGKRLYRSRTNRMVGGVIGGFAEMMNTDATVLRVIYAFLTLFTGIWYGLLLYIIAMIIVPEEPYPAGWVPPAAPSAPTPPAPPAPPVPGPSGTAPQPPAPPVPPAPSAPGGPMATPEPPAAPPIPPAQQ